MITSIRNWKRGATAGMMALMLLSAGLAVAAPAAHAGETHSVGEQAPASPAVTTQEGLFFGAELDWSTVDAAAYTEQSGITPSFFSRPFAYPMTPSLEEDLRNTALQAAQLGSLIVITLEPSKPLAELTEDDAVRLSEVLQGASEEYGTAFFVRFAPEMNGTWYEWGQKPTDYVSAFRTVAAALDAGAPTAQMLWAPSYAAGYPFTEAYGALDGPDDRTLRALDTNGDGLVEPGDDPYLPYYPGDDVVDWVGLTMYHYGSYQPGAVADIDDEREYSGAIITSVLPEQDKFETQLEGTYGMAPGAPQINFAKEYAADRGKRLFIQTAALYDPEDPDSSEEVEIKSAWLNQLMDPAIAEEYPEIGMISWLDAVRTEPEAEGRTVDWRVGGEEDTSAILRESLDGAAGVVLAPVVEPYVQPQASEGEGVEAGENSGVARAGLGTTIVVWVSALAVGLVILWLLALAIRKPKPRRP